MANKSEVSGRIDKAVEKERERCLRCVDAFMEEAGKEGGYWGGAIHRIRNQIANGLEPISMAEQFEPEDGE